MTIGKPSRRRVLATGLCTLALPRPVWSQPTQRDVEGGIGGTGIVGVLTGFDKLQVSGNAVSTDSQTSFSDGFGATNLPRVALGDSLTIEAAGPLDALVARRVHVTHPLVGRISAINPDSGTLVVNGVNIYPEFPQPQLTTGDRVAVSGLWRGPSVIASRITSAQTGQDLISGDVRRSFGAVRLGTVDLRGRGVSSLTAGSFVTALGRYTPENGRFQAETLKPNRFVGSAGSLTHLSVEGYLEPISAAPGFRVAGLGHSLARNLRLTDYAGARILLNGPYTGKFAANRAVILPEDPQKRRSFLATFTRSAG